VGRFLVATEGYIVLVQRCIVVLIERRSICSRHSQPTNGSSPILHGRWCCPHLLGSRGNLDRKTIKNLKPNMVIAAHIIVLGSWENPWMCPYWAWIRYTARRPKYSGTALSQILVIHFFLFFLLTPLEFLHETSPIRIIISLCFK
jgi:hypothetical protein